MKNIKQDNREIKNQIYYVNGSGDEDTWNSGRNRLRNQIKQQIIDYKNK